MYTLIVFTVGCVSTAIMAKIGDVIISAIWMFLLVLFGLISLLFNKLVDLTAYVLASLGIIKR